jgi:hypothetical protein
MLGGAGGAVGATCGHVAGGGRASVVALCICVCRQGWLCRCCGAVCVSWCVCHKCGWLSGQTYTLPHLKNLSGSQTSVPFSSSHLSRASVLAISEPGRHLLCSLL